MGAGAERGATARTARTTSSELNHEVALLMKRVWVEDAGAASEELRWNLEGLAKDAAWSLEQATMKPFTECAKRRARTVPGVLGGIHGAAGILGGGGTGAGVHSGSVLPIATGSAFVCHLSHQALCDLYASCIKRVMCGMC